MSSKEFDLLMSLILRMLENGQSQEVIDLIKSTIGKDDDKPEK